MSIYAEILDWAKSRPLWQQDALRRLIAGAVSTQDVNDITNLARAEYGITVENAGVAEPPLPDAAPVQNGRVTVALRRIGEMQHVNALKPDQSLSFSDTGITVVYGENGAGKSGYARVLKQVCRARGGGDAVLPNVYVADAAPAAATIEYDVDGVRQVLSWSRNAPKPQELAEVSVFDSKSASVYVTEEAEVAYLPFGIDLFPRLSRVCDSVRTRLEAERASLLHQSDRWPEFPTATAVYRCLQNLHMPGDRGVCERMAALSALERQELDGLRAKDRKYRTDDPPARAIALRQTVQRITVAANAWKEVATCLADENLAEYRTAQHKYEVALEAARIAANKAFDDAPLAGTGSPAWQVLWRAARTFAESRTPSTQAFPTPAGSPCLLCQHDVSEATEIRLKRFEDFIRSEVQRNVDLAAGDVDSRRSRIAQCRPSDVAPATLVEELKTLDTTAGEQLADSLARLTERQQIALASTAPAELPQLVDPLPALRDVVTRLTSEARVFEAASQPEERTRLEASLAELEAREKLGEVFDRIDAQINRAQRSQLLEQAIASANTTPITKYSRDLLNTAVTAPLADAFQRQREALNLTHIPIGLTEARGEKGTAVHSLALQQNNSVDAAADAVLSEGEHRCIALAAFFAEVGLQESKSTLVLDDPVSSLDHGRREYVAEQLTRFAERRPVIVFTHDLVLLWLLQDRSDGRVAFTARAMRRGSRVAGFISNDPPWDGQKVKQRIGVLKNFLVTLQKEAEDEPDKYEKRIREFYGRLRDTWERAVEEILLQGAIRRFAPEIKTQSLKNLHKLRPELLAALDAGMTKASNWVQGHDHAAGLGAIAPTPDEARLDLAHLEEWVKEVNAMHHSGSGR